MLGVLTVSASAQVGVMNTAFTAIPSSNDAFTGVVAYQELESNGTDLVGFRAPASVTTQVIWILPDADGSVNQAMCTDAAGTLTWCSPAFTDVENEFTEKNIFSRDGGALLLGRNTEVTNFTSSIMTVVSNGTKLSLRTVGGGPALAMWKDEAAGGGGPTIAAAIGLSIPGVAAGNDLVLSTFATGGSWNGRFTVENDGDIAIDVGHHYMANNTKLFFDDTAATPINLFWLDGSNFLNIGTIDAISGDGDVIFYRDGTAAFKISGFGGDETWQPAVDSTKRVGAPSFLVSVGHFVTVELGRGTGSPPAKNGLIRFSGTGGASFADFQAIDLSGSGGIQFVGAGIVPSVSGSDFLGTTSLRWDGFFDDIDISGTCTGCSGLPVVDTTSIVEGSSDATKEIRFEVDVLTTGTVRVLTPPDADITIAGIDLAQTWTATQTTQHLVPSAHNTYDVGSASNYWDEINSVDFRAGFASASSPLQGRVIFANTDLLANVATISGGTKNSGAQFHATASVDHLVITSSFYINQDAGDLACTNVANGRFVQATASNEYQVCEGAATFLTPYISTSFAPVTLNCTSGQSLEDPRFEKGLLVEGSCVTR